MAGAGRGAGREEKHSTCVYQTNEIAQVSMVSATVPISEPFNQPTCVSLQYEYELCSVFAGQ